MTQIAQRVVEESLLAQGEDAATSFEGCMERRPAQPACG